MAGSTSNPKVTVIEDGASAKRLILRINAIDEAGEQVNEPTTDQVVLEGIIGSPEGVSVGSPGDLRIREDDPQVWQKIVGVRTKTGWQLVGGGGGGGNVCSAIPQLLVAGSSGSPGIDGTASACDHEHPVPVAAPVTVTGGSNVEGASAALSRRDHQHRLEVQIQQEGVAIGARPIVNVLGDVVSADDNVNDRVDIDFAPTATPLEFEIDFTDQGTRSLLDGVDSLDTTDGDPIPILVALAPGSAGPVPDTLDLSPAGLVWVHGDLGTSWQSGAPTSGTRLFIAMGDIFSLLDSDVTWRYRVDCYGTDYTFSATASFVVGLWGNAGDVGSVTDAPNRLAGGGRALQGGIPVWRPIAGGTAPNYTTAPGPTTDVTGFTVLANTVMANAGTWPGSWAAYRPLICWNVGGSGQLNGVAPPFVDEHNLVALGFSSLGTTPGNATVTLERMRVQATPFFV